jgi:hypothetical protein
MNRFKLVDCSAETTILWEQRGVLSAEILTSEIVVQQKRTKTQTFAAVWTTRSKNKL